jgi:hypothetical protein
MATNTWKVGGCFQKTGIQTEYTNMKHKQTIVNSESVKLNDLVSAECLIEFTLDFDELQYVYLTACQKHCHPYVLN